MSVEEIVGFAISILALLFLFFKNRRVLVHRENDVQEIKRRVFIEEEQDEEDDLKELIHAFKGTLKGEKAIPPLPLQKPFEAQKRGSLSKLEGYHLASPIEKRQVKSPLESRQLKSSLAQREMASQGVSAPFLYHFDEKTKVAPSRAHNAMTRLAHWPDIVIYTEILSPPKSMRPD